MHPNAKSQPNSCPFIDEVMFYPGIYHPLHGLAIQGQLEIEKRN